MKFADLKNHVKGVLSAFGKRPPTLKELVEEIQKEISTLGGVIPSYDEIVEMSKMAWHYEELNRELFTFSESLHWIKANLPEGCKKENELGMSTQARVKYKYGKTNPTTTATCSGI